MNAHGMPQGAFIRRRYAAGLTSPLLTGCTSDGQVASRLLLSYLAREIIACASPDSPSSPRNVRAAVGVMWALPPESPPPGAVTPLARKRLSYWHDGPRNDLLATVAIAFRAGDQETLWRSGLCLADGYDIGTVGEGDRVVTLLAESTEHAEELLKRLPGWSLLCAVPASRSVSVECFPVDPLDKHAITYAASRLPCLDADVLIFAGPEYPIALPGFSPQTFGLSRLIRGSCSSISPMTAMRRPKLPSRRSTWRAWLCAIASYSTPRAKRRPCLRRATTGPGSSVTT